ncbi:MAG: diaminopimelate epimerase [Vulcanimicrobiaceae bacterium]
MNATAAVDGYKMHGAHNTFVLVDDRARARDAYDELARRVCAPDGPFDGADGLLVVGRTPGAFAHMRIFNADGSEPEMCGNGVRCVARYLADRGAPQAFTIGTLAGPIATEIVSREPFEARIDVGTVTFAAGVVPEALDVLGTTYAFVEVSLGNPHAVVFVDDERAIDLETLGRALNAHPRFPHGINLHVARVADGPALVVRHYERGVGLTQACGTGAVACAAVAIVTRGCTSPVTVHVPGGTLHVAWQPGATARLTGPAEPLFARPLPR